MEKLTIEERKRRRFSESFKRKKVQEIESGQTKISEICRVYQVKGQNVYRWLHKYGSMKQKKERLVIEAESDTLKVIELEKQVAELERIIGQKQIEIDFKDKMIELAEEVYHVDIKKKFCTGPSNGSGGTGTNTHTR